MRLVSYSSTNPHVTPDILNGMTGFCEEANKNISPVTDIP